MAYMGIYTSSVIVIFVGYCFFPMSESVEYCMSETFTAKCPENEVILMTNAVVGRMKIGRCITVNLGHLGCSANILDVMDRFCSGKNECAVPVVSDELSRIKACSELRIALEASYTCIQVSNSDRKQCTGGQRIAISNENLHMSSQIAYSTGCGEVQSPWYLHANPGQTLQIIITILSSQSIGGQGGKCKTIGYGFEDTLKINKTLCVQQKRNQVLYKAVGNQAVIYVLPKERRTDIGDFYIHYEVLGCPDLDVPDNAVYSREGPKAEYGCKYSKKTWKLQCVENSWAGVIGNCSEIEYSNGKIHFEKGIISPSIPDSVIIAIIIGGALLIASLIFISALVCIWNKRSSHPKPENTYNRERVPTMPRCVGDPNQQYRTLTNKQYHGNPTLPSMSPGTLQYGNMQNVPTGKPEYNTHPDTEGCDCYYPTSDASYEFNEGRKYHVLERQPPEQV